MENLTWEEWRGLILIENQTNAKRIISHSILTVNTTDLIARLSSLPVADFLAGSVASARGLRERLKEKIDRASVIYVSRELRSRGRRLSHSHTAVDDMQIRCRARTGSFPVKESTCDTTANESSLLAAARAEGFEKSPCSFLQRSVWTLGSKLFAEKEQKSRRVQWTLGCPSGIHLWQIRDPRTRVSVRSGSDLNANRVQSTLLPPLTIDSEFCRC